MSNTTKGRRSTGWSHERTLHDETYDGQLTGTGKHRPQTLIEAFKLHVTRRFGKR